MQLSELESALKSYIDSKITTLTNSVNTINSQLTVQNGKIDNLEDSVFADIIEGYSISRDSDLAANTDFSIGIYIVGSKKLNVFLNGLRCQEGIDFNEIGTAGQASNIIQFADIVKSNVCIVWRIE